MTFSGNHHDWTSCCAYNFRLDGASFATPFAPHSCCTCSSEACLDSSQRGEGRLQAVPRQLLDFVCGRVVPSREPVVARSAEVARHLALKSFVPPATSNHTFTLCLAAFTPSGMLEAGRPAQKPFFKKRQTLKIQACRSHRPKSTELKNDREAACGSLRIGHVVTPVPRTSGNQPAKASKGRARAGFRTPRLQEGIDVTL